MPNFINANPRLFLIAFTAFVNLVVVGLRSFTGYEVPQEFVGAVNTLAVALATLIVGDTIKDRDVVAAKVMKEHGIEFRSSSRGVAHGDLVFTAGVLVLLGGGVVASCKALGGDWRPVTALGNEAAQAICAETYAEQKRMSLEQAGEKFCSTLEQLQPFIDIATAARAQGTERVNGR